MALKVFIALGWGLVAADSNNQDKCDGIDNVDPTTCLPNDDAGADEVDPSTGKAGPGSGWINARFWLSNAHRVALWHMKPEDRQKFKDLIDKDTNVPVPSACKKTILGKDLFFWPKMNESECQRQFTVSAFRLLADKICRTVVDVDLYWYERKWVRDTIVIQPGSGFNNPKQMSCGNMDKNIAGTKNGDDFLKGIALACCGTCDDWTVNEPATTLDYSAFDANKVDEKYVKCTYRDQDPEQDPYQIVWDTDSVKKDGPGCQTLADAWCPAEGSRQLMPFLSRSAAEN